MVLKKIVKWARVRSPWILHLNTGGCNGCDIEVLAVLIPKWDVERFGVLLQGSPRHADVIVFTGPITNQTRDRMKRIYEQTPDPKFVVAVGACALSGGVFEEGYNVLGGADKAMPVSAYIPGCPPKPEAILDGIVKLVTALEQSE
ncbi:NADH-quinone oxidoreductase subunit B family protein [Candidatus Borrarchaeum sp.]|jgi:NADH-quinone oxidoreductase B subunit|uniref:NADH-quinone oxidoreductase subunit B family protein n=1 Tax=Candidatus Borrarchaeum sp. TaxID=2846742 RepID=UPI00257E2038|nr:NADH-quinone oxidoreductase subunit B family protein [Candidatus Borrarchaeum sp.]